MDDMALLCDLFLRPLESSGIISRNEAWTLFGNVQELQTINAKLLHRLQAVKHAHMEANQPLATLQIGTVLAEAEEPLEKYAGYCTNQSAAFAALEDMKEANAEFAKFLTVCGGRVGGMRGIVGGF